MSEPRLFTLEEWRWRLLYAAHLINLWTLVGFVASLPLFAYSAFAVLELEAHSEMFMFIVAGVLIGIALILEWAAYLPVGALPRELSSSLEKCFHHWLLVLLLKIAVVVLALVQLDYYLFRPSYVAISLLAVFIAVTALEHFYKRNTGWDLMPTGSWDEVPFKFCRPVRAFNIYPESQKEANAH